MPGMQGAINGGSFYLRRGSTGTCSRLWLGPLLTAMELSLRALPVVLLIPAHSQSYGQRQGYSAPPPVLYAVSYWVILLVFTSVA